MSISDASHARAPYSWGVRLHMKLLGACSDAVDQAAKAAVDKISPPAAACFRTARRAAVLDYCYTATLRAVNGVSTRAFQHQIFSAESVKTLKEQKREREIEEYRKFLGENTVYPDFCRTAAEYIHVAIPRFFGESLSVFPSFTEGMLLFRLGLPIRYLNYKVNQRTGYREKLIASIFGKRVQGLYVGKRTQLAHMIAGSHNITPLINFDHLLLKLCVKSSTMYKKKPTRNLTGILLKSFGSSFAKQDELDRFLESLDLHSDEERMIARIEWHKRNRSLPIGMPDPRQISLTADNLHEKLDESLYGLMEKLVAELVNKGPSVSKTSFLGMFYAIEGKDLLIQLLTYLVSEFGVKQLADPHLFALAILYAGGQEVADYELDGFGRNAGHKIQVVGKELLKEVLEGKLSWFEINQIYEESGLKPSPGSLEGLMQQKEAKEHLRQYIASLIYDMIKENQFRHRGLLKGVRERASRLPAIGMAALSLHFLINGVLFSFSYLFRDRQQTDTSFLVWMGKNFTGRSLCNFLADKIVDLIYHPSWRITLMQCIEDLLEELKKPRPSAEESENLFAAEDFKPITDFIFKHFVRDSQIPFEANIAPLVDYFKGEEMFHQFQELIKPSDEPLLDKALEALMPTIKELMLYTRVIDAFRKDYIAFDGDAKFWEIFIRESLNRLVSDQIADTTKYSAKPKSSDLAAIRNVFVERMLAMDDQELRKYLSGIPENSIMMHQWEDLPGSTDELNTLDARYNLEAAVQWDYLDDSE